MYNFALARVKIPLITRVWYERMKTENIVLHFVNRNSSKNIAKNRVQSVKIFAESMSKQNTCLLPPLLPKKGWIVNSSDNSAFL